MARALITYSTDGKRVRNERRAQPSRDAAHAQQRADSVLSLIAAEQALIGTPVDLQRREDGVLVLKFTSQTTGAAHELHATVCN